MKLFCTILIIAIVWLLVSIIIELDNMTGKLNGINDRLDGIIQVLEKKCDTTK